MIYRFVRHANVQDFLDCGWHIACADLGPPHNQYAILLRWICQCERAEPQPRPSFTATPLDLPFACPPDVGTTTRPNIWDDPQRVADLKQLASEGFSSGKIAKAMGISRNAVIGKLRRLGVPLLNPPNGAPNAQASPRVRESTTRRDTPPSQQIAPEAPPRPYDGIGKSIFELTSDTCRWPLGDPGRTGFHFCGATPDGLSPYCCEHAALATR